MALFSTKSVYGLCALAELLGASSQNPKPIKEISQKTEISQNYIEQIFNVLKNNNILMSVRGSKGGYFLAKNPENISIREILTILDGKIETTNLDVKSSEISLYFYRKDEKINEIFDEPLSDILALKQTINYII